MRRAGNPRLPQPIEEQSQRPVVFVGSSRRDLQAMPGPVRELMGTAIRWAQTGGVGPDGKRQLGLHPEARKMKDDLSDVVEVRDDHDGDAFRTMYTAKVGETIYVLHAFQKKSKSGIATPKSELDLVRQRLKDARSIEQRLAERRAKP